MSRLMGGCPFSYLLEIWVLNGFHVILPHDGGVENVFVDRLDGIAFDDPFGSCVGKAVEPDAPLFPTY